MSSGNRLTPWDKESEYRIVSSASSLGADGFAMGEPKYLECAECGARVLLTRERSHGIDWLKHAPECPNDRARSRWFREHFRWLHEDV